MSKLFAWDCNVESRLHDYVPGKSVFIDLCRLQFKFPYSVSVQFSAPCLLRWVSTVRLQVFITKGKSLDYLILSLCTLNEFFKQI